MMKKPLKIVLFIFLGLIVLGILGSMLGDKNPKDNKSAEKDPVVAAQNNDSIETQKKKDYTFTADKLVAEYTDNEVRADDNFKGKTFWVTGTIENIGKDVMDKSYVSFKSTDDIRSVQCFIDDTKLLSSLNKGMKVTVKGTCKGMFGNVLMEDCELASK